MTTDDVGAVLNAVRDSDLDVLMASEEKWGLPRLLLLLNTAVGAGVVTRFGAIPGHDSLADFAQLVAAEAPVGRLDVEALLRGVVLDDTRLLSDVDVEQLFPVVGAVLRVLMDDLDDEEWHDVVQQVEQSLGQAGSE